MSSLTKVWNEVRMMLNDGLSLIPVRDKKQGDFMPKTPFGSWKHAQNKAMTESELWQMMEEKKTEAVALVCGKVSGNLELIDIDSKYFEGISIRLFKEIKSLRPDLYDKLRVHKTPSGGYHILYRIADGDPEKNQKLAERAKTEDEINADIAMGIKKPKKFVAFLETRGEGGFALMPPSMGYDVHLDRPIPLISWADRCELIQICRSFNENIPKKVTYKRTKIQDNTYDLTPWEDYNENGDVVALLEEYGWKLHRHQTPERLYFIRPGKDKGISASLTRSNHKFYPFTVSTELESEKTYSPCDLLVIYRFNGDKSAAFKWMVDNGYGRVKKRVEQQIIKTSLHSRQDVPANFSPEAKSEFEKLKQESAENMPYGIFWEQDPDKPHRFNISREDLYKVSECLGFKIFNDAILVQVSGGVISARTESQYFDAIKAYIWEEEADTYTAICNSLEAFFQKSGKYTISRLRPIDNSLVMSDTATTCYKYFQNGFIEINAKGYTFKPYTEITGLVWEHKVRPRDFDPTPTKEYGVYAEYLQNAIGITPYLRRVIGNLSVDYKDEACSYIFVLTEKVENPKDGGGSGKNVFGNILKETTTVKTVPGSSVKFDDRFMAAWNYERIYFLADIPKRIDWMFLKELCTGEGYVNKKYKAEVTVEAGDMPKLLLNTNYSYEEEDGGVKRRIRHVEFTPYYTIHGGVDAVHGKMFPRDFTAEDWRGYDHFIADCISEAYKHNLKIEKTDLSEEGWIKQFRNSYGEATHQFITDNMDMWLQNGFVSNKQFNDQYREFSEEFDIPQKFRLSSRRMNEAIKDFCDKNKVFFDPNFRDTINGMRIRGKKIGDQEKQKQDDCPF